MFISNLVRNSPLFANTLGHLIPPSELTKFLPKTNPFPTKIFTWQNYKTEVKDQVKTAIPVLCFGELLASIEE